ncbi:MAG: uracil-DNA glycosylase [Vibrionaceae bacterium]
MSEITWQALFSEESKKPYFAKLESAVATARQTSVVFPPPESVYQAFELTPFCDVKVVILGQDPYHGAGQAHGLAFSVAHGVKVPPSLANIYKELCQDVAGFTPPAHGNLSAWAKQGVLLLNTVLTVQQGLAHSHAKFGWEMFSDAMISALSARRDGLIFLLWGEHAKKKAQLIDKRRHVILQAAHPSPFSAYRGFLGCRHFSAVNALLQQKGQRAIDWQL